MNTFEKLLSSAEAPRARRIFEETWQRVECSLASLEQEDNVKELFLFELRERANARLKTLRREMDDDDAIGKTP